MTAVCTALTLHIAVFGADQRPNFVLVMADDQGWGDMAYNGHPVLKTPHFDAAAASGLRFDRFYAAAPVCSPTRASVLTGRHPNRMGVFKWGFPMRPQELTLAELLRESGYATAHFGKWHLGSVRRNSPASPGANGFDRWRSAPNFYDNDAVMSDEGTAVACEGESSAIAVDAAIEWLQSKAGADQPLLAIVWFGSPHSPHQAAQEDRAPYQQLPEKLQHFYGEITGMDRAFGRLREALQHLGLRENTLLWYCSDNGGLPRVGSTGGRGHKGDVYEGGLLVPAILEWPARISKPRVTQMRANTCDILPTLLELAGVDPPSRPLDGISLTKLISGKQQERRKPMGFWDFQIGGRRVKSDALMTELLEAQAAGKDLTADAGSLAAAKLPNPPYRADELARHAAWLDGHWKLHRIAKQNQPVRWELYDLKADPGEQHDVAGEQPQRVARMQQALGRWQASVIHSLNGGDYAEYPLGGAKRPDPAMTLKRRDQYKRVHQVALRYLLRGRTAQADAFLRRFLEENPDDAETHFLLGALYAQRGEKDQAVAALEQAVALGLPPARIDAGPRKIFATLSDHADFQRLVAANANRLVHGPLLGNVTDKSASFWVRTAGETSVSVTVFGVAPESNGNAQPGRVIVSTGTSRTSASSDFTTVCRVEGLQPDTAYRYRVTLGDRDVFGQTDRGTSYQFRTFPSSAQPAKFTLAFGGGAGYVPPHERMWNTIAQFNPAALLLLGDNVYIDDPESPAMQRYTYYRRQSRPEWRSLTSRTAVYAIWDDHDFGTNDCWGGAAVATPFWKEQYSWPIFQQNWANPPYGGQPHAPGCYFRFAIGNVDFFMLDCRYYRTDPKEETPSMLGPKQMKWLRRELQSAAGQFKVICSSVPWDFRTKGDSLDTWNGYQNERNEIFDFLTKHRIEGVILLSADRHRSDAWRIERPGDYALYEFNSSRLTNQHVHARMEDQGALFSYNQKQSFGLVHFDTTGDDPSAKYEVVSIDGESIHAVSVFGSQLTSPGDGQ